MSAIQLLRLHTAPLHDGVDAAFGGYDLADRDDYRRFLLAHARALPGIEAALNDGGVPVRVRTPLIAADLAALGTAMPEPAPFVPPAGAAALWGARYVVEGSRLGGTMLARRVGDGLPRAYLAAAHLPGEWRALREATDAEAERHGEAWRSAMIEGATQAFAAYAAAAGNQILPRQGEVAGKA